MSPESLTRSIRFIIEFIMKLSSVRRKDSDDSKNHVLLGEAIVVNATLNQDTSCSEPQTIIAHFSHIRCVYLAN